MRDDDRLLDLPGAQFGSGIIGICDICGTRQAVIVLSKERYKLCVIDFLNKAWVKSERKPGAPAPVYRSDRIWFETATTKTGRSMAVVLSPTKVGKHPVVLVTPDVYGITTTLLDGAIRLAREGFEVMIPDLLKTEGVGASTHLSMRSGTRLGGGLSTESKTVGELVRLYADALAHLRAREMVDPAKSALFGTSYGGSLALALAARDTKLAAVALAYPMPVRPAGITKLVSAPVLYVGGSSDRWARKARAQLESSRVATHGTVEFVDLPDARHDFLSRDLPAYDLPKAEQAWGRIVAFLKQRLMPPPPRPPPPPVKPASAVAPPPKPVGPAPTAAPLPAPAAGTH
jgi:carboxymethylenebutenolidase